MLFRGDLDGFGLQSEREYPISKREDYIIV